MENYHFTGPAPEVPGPPADPVVSELREIQNTLLFIMREANFNGDYETAMAAAAQAAANAQVIGVITERLQSAAAAKGASDETQLKTPVYSILLKDQTVHFASVYWTDKLMLHYLTPQGAHEQIRLDLVDFDLSTRLNREKNLDFRLSQ
jgi:hypothetical protein